MTHHDHHAVRGGRDGGGRGNGQHPVDAMGRLRRMDDLAAYWTEINRLENEADDAYRRLLGELLGRATDAVELLKVKEVVDTLEAAADAFETVAHHVETIAVKES